MFVISVDQDKQACLLTHACIFNSGEHSWTKKLTLVRRIWSKISWKFQKQPLRSLLNKKLLSLLTFNVLNGAHPLSNRSSAGISKLFISVCCKQYVNINRHMIQHFYNKIIIPEETVWLRGRYQTTTINNIVEKNASQTSKDPLLLKSIIIAK